MITRRAAVAELYATLVVISITFSMSYVIYSELSAPRTGDRLVFLNRTSVIEGPPELVLLQVNVSKPTTLVSVQIDNISASSGILALGLNGYANSPTPCGSGLVTFFSVRTSAPAQLNLRSNGETWMGGYWSNAGAVGVGWTEVMINNASSCSVSVPGGTISTLPLSGTNESTNFRLFLPVASGTHYALLMFTGGFDKVAFSA